MTGDALRGEAGGPDISPPAKRRGLSRALKALVSVGIVALLFRRVPATDVLGALRLARGGPILLASAVSLATHLFLAWRLRILTRKQGIHLGFWSIVEVNLTTMFYRLFIPGGTVGSLLVRVYKLTRSEKKYPEAVAAVVFDRVAATAALCLVGGVFWLIDRPATGIGVQLAMIGLLLVTLGFLALLLSRRAADLFLGIARWLPLGSVGAKIEKQILAARRFHDIGHGTLALVLGISVVTQLLGLATYGFLGLALALAIPWVTWGWIRSAAIVVAMLPVSVAGIGVREGALLFLVQAAGGTAENALAFSLLVLFTTVLLLSLVGGLIEAARLFRGRRAAGR